MGHLLIENRHGLIVDVRATHATGRAEREAAEAMIAAAARGRHATLGADKAYDAAEHVANLRAIGITHHVARNLSGRRSAIDGRSTRHRGYAISQRIRNASRSRSVGRKPPPGSARPVIAGSAGSDGS